MSSNNVTKICEYCGNGYECSYRTRNTSKFCSSSCRTNNHNNIKNKKLIDYVICPICNKKYKEINNTHIKMHGLTMYEWNIKYPNFERLSNNARYNKGTLRMMTSEISMKLKKSHTLDGYIEKYGEEIGKEKYLLRCENINNARQKEYYIEKYGILEYEKIKKSKGITLNKYIIKYGEEVGKEKYNMWLVYNKTKNTLPFYLNKYGEKEGYNKWFIKNKKNSESSRHIEINKISEYQQYCIEVDKETRISLQLNKLDNIELRGKEYHLDHMISKCYGFNNNISSKIIGSIYNLKIIPSSENLSKQKKCSITLEELNNKINNK